MNKNAMRRMKKMQGEEDEFSRNEYKKLGDWMN